MRIRFAVFGVEVWTLEFGDEPMEEEPVEQSGITGGSAQNFERDYAPATPEDRYRWEEDRFGFRACTPQLKLPPRPDFT
jgi:hypothetical protein